MYLVTAATEFEMAPIRHGLAAFPVHCLVTGVGILETAVTLCRYLEGRRHRPAGVVNLGVAGAFVGSGVGLLDLCLADREVLGDFGICMGDAVIPFGGEAMAMTTEFSLLNPLRSKAAAILDGKSIPYASGAFVTVNSVSGREKRGSFLCDHHRAICENMEGAAVARVCAAFDLHCLELRSVSNLVEDRDPGRWRLKSAVAACAEAAVALIPSLLGDSP